MPSSNSANTPLQQGVVYLSPLGKRCVLGPPRRLGPQHITMLYVPTGAGPQSQVVEDGFTLSQANAHLLRKVGEVGR